MENLEISCTCTKLKGRIENVSPNKGTHLVCMCIDCQTFAHYLGRSEEILDSHGGTELYQTSPSQIKITEGEQYLKCFKLSPKGTRRWFASCCNTPIANMVSLKFDFAGVITKCIKNQDLNKKIGPVKHKVMAQYSLGEPPEGSSQGFPKLLTAKIMFNVIKGKITKNYMPNTFFNNTSGEAINSPEITIDKNNRKELRKKIMRNM